MLAFSPRFCHKRRAGTVVAHRPALTATMMEHRMADAVDSAIAHNPTSGERWLPIPGYEEIYEVSDLGRVRSLDRVIYKRVTRDGPFVRTRRKGKILSGALDTHGYWMVNLCVDGTSKTALVHQLVLTAFVCSKPEGLECRHLDGVRVNNRLSNLIWGTTLENSEDKKRHGTVSPPRGENHGRSKLNESAIRDIRARMVSGETAASVGRSYNISGHHVRKIANRRAWAHVS